MHQGARRVIFALFATTFFVGAPLIVFYTAGYRVNLTTWRVQQTGVIALSSLPKGASISMNSTALNAKTPYVIQRLSPGKYTIDLQKDGYKPWNQIVTVDSGETTYATATLFADATPQLLSNTAAIAVSGEVSGRFVDLLLQDESGKQTIERYDTVTNLSRAFAILDGQYTTMTRSVDDSTIILTNATEKVGIDANTGVMLTPEALTVATSTLPGYEFFDNGSQTEFRTSDSHTLVALLPPSTYTVAFSNASLAVFSDTRERSYLFHRASNTVKQMNISAKRIAASTTEPLLATSDGNEIDLYNITTGEVTLITRQSEPILSLAWHTDQRTLLCATATHIFGIEQENYTSRDATTLVDNAAITDMWPDTTGKHITFYGTISGTTGIWSLALTQ